MSEAVGKQWAILVAGAKDWYNYGLQANICHAYQLVHRNGIPDEQTVVMMYDDIADNEQNPYKGNIINQPNGPNVYPGVLKDYTGDDVTPENFLAALRGDESAVIKTGPKKVIKSGKNDTIFVFLSDHGAPGLFCFPSSSLYAIDFIEELQTMAKNKQFAKMVIFMECCYSGSMLENLPENISIYGVTACPPDTEAYFCFFDGERQTFLAAEMSAVWMSYTEVSVLDKITFQDEFRNLQGQMKKSVPCEYGDKDVSMLTVSKFLKNSPASAGDTKKGLSPTDLVSFYEAPFRILEYQIEREADPVKNDALKKKYDDLRKTKSNIESAVEEMRKYCSAGGVEHATTATTSLNLNQLQHFKTVAEFFRTTCFNWHESQFQYALSQLNVFNKLCAAGVDTKGILEAIKQVRRTSSVFE
ncbi:legumain-like [Pygocentrus nattereri]|uniref:legumain-like n=1 Tax=Pygocentrus nattereri TaxID=42514 RepID=UPI00189198CD|nr:legumain-like [Pygocentrus nattereri]XP_037399884.1 legumain-like [Pygocentrus nattereri]XP_037399885.1 legumain-like [Pygocentrus nattereri]